VLISKAVHFAHAYDLFAVEGRLVKRCREESKNIELLKMFSRFVRPQAVSALYSNAKNFSTSNQVVISAHSMLKINIRFCWYCS